MKSSKSNNKFFSINIFWFLLPLVLGLVLGVFWHGLRQQTQDDVFVLYNKKMPLMVFSSFDGNHITTDDLLKPSSPMVLNVFASWCAPCIAEMPMLQSMQPLLKEYNVRLIGINWQDKKNSARRFLQKYGDPFDSVIVDRNGKAMVDMGLVGVPETYVIDKNGVVRFRKVGPIITDQDRDEILMAIKKWQ
ncbi:MAG: redoxin domain-containing protein [Alphaproteobacteria bacterium]